MRYLTIKIAKKFSSFNKSATFYVEDHENYNTLIGDIPYRQLGVIKNGEEKTFQIEEGAVRLCAVTGANGGKSVNDFCAVPAGTENAVLYGELLNGHVFFENDFSPQTVEKRKSKDQNKKLAGAFALLFGIFFGVYSIVTAVMFSLANSEKTFKVNDMSITLTRSFVEMEDEESDFYFSSGKVYVWGKLSDVMPSYVTARVFAENILKQYGKLGFANIYSKDGLLYFGFDYKDKDTEAEYYCYGFVYKHNNRFLLIEFVTEKENRERYREDILEWAKSVQFEEKEK